MLGSAVQAFAATETGGTDIWSKAKEFLSSVYTQLLGLSTLAAVVTICIALLLMNFSKNGKTVDEARAWIKRIVISYVVINALGFILAYITPFLQGGQWQATV